MDNCLDVFFYKYGDNAISIFINLSIKVMRVSLRINMRWVKNRPFILKINSVTCAWARVMSEQEKVNCF